MISKRNITLDQIRNFISVAKEGHLGRAAKTLRLSPSAVSHSVAQLEENLGFALFLRVGRGLLLTERGKRFLERGDELLERVDKIGEGLTEIPVVHRLRCGGPPSLVDLALAPALTKVSRRFPQCAMAFQYSPSAELEDKLADGSLDIGLMYAEDRKIKTPHIGMHSDPLYFCVRPDHPILRIPGPSRWATLSEYPMVSPQPAEVLLKNPEPAIKKLFKQGAQIRYQIPSYNVGAKILCATDGWAIFPAWVIQVFGLALVRQEAACRPTMITFVYRKELAGTDLLDEVILRLKLNFEHPIR